MVAAGQANFSTTINANGCNNIKIIGAASDNGGAAACCALFYTGTGIPVTATDSHGFQFSHMQLEWTNSSFGGPVIRLSDGISETDHAEIDHSTFVSGSVNAPIILDLNFATRIRVRGNTFGNYVVAIRGAASGSSFSNAIEIDQNNFSSSTGTAVTAHIQNPGSGWKISNNTFEMGTAAGKPAVIQCSGNVSPIGISIDSNWVGDEGTGTWTYITGCTGSGWSITGNYFGPDPAFSNTFMSIGSGFTGLTVIGNRFDHLFQLFTGMGNATAVLLSGNSDNSSHGWDAAPVSGFMQLSSNGGAQDLYGNLALHNNLTVAGNLTVTGTKSSIAQVSGRRQVALYAMESPENWFEDFGTARLHNGKARVTLESIFSETVNSNLNYHVFLTANGNCRGLYVAEKTTSGFVVRELNGGRSNVSFDYRVVVRRKGYETQRLSEVPGTQEGNIRQSAIRGTLGQTDAP